MSVNNRDTGDAQHTTETTANGLTLVRTEGSAEKGVPFDRARRVAAALPRGCDAVDRIQVLPKMGAVTVYLRDTDAGVPFDLLQRFDVDDVDTMVHTDTPFVTVFVDGGRA